MAGIGKVGGILFHNSGIVKEELVDPFFDLTIFWFSRTEMRMTSSGNSSASISSFKSVLLRRTMRLVMSERARRARSWSVSFSDALRTSRIISFRQGLAEQTPLFFLASISSVSRMPAVSMSLRKP